MGGWDNGLWQHAAGMSVFLVWFSCLSDLYVCTSDHCLSALSLLSRSVSLACVNVAV